jgi:hypothetical protein
MRVAALRIVGEGAQWRALGFDVTDEGTVMLGAIRVELLASGRPGTIESWALEGPSVPDSIDGLPTEVGARGGPQAAHPNGVVGIDHVVVLTPSLERTTAAFAEVGIGCRRVRGARGGVRQGFFLLADLLVEVVDETGLEGSAPARFWGLTAAADLHSAASLLGDRLGPIRDAVQPGRRIATVRADAAGGLPLALISPRSE